LASFLGLGSLAQISLPLRALAPPNIGFARALLTIVPPARPPPPKIGFARADIARISSSFRPAELGSLARFSRAILLCRPAEIGFARALSRPSPTCSACISPARAVHSGESGESLRCSRPDCQRAGCASFHFNYGSGRPFSFNDLPVFSEDLDIMRADVQLPGDGPLVVLQESSY
jgi:hypothetical protein